MKSVEVFTAATAACRLPHGGRGLKCEIPQLADLIYGKSSPARGTWVEIELTPDIARLNSVVSRTGDVG